ncbi:metallophosphoesterase [Streptomyces sp. TG1A-60]|uniref:metallophosphoesterase family protein n=1 Tax=Streptomyces sp. TG1A-60 TaxID=3129111 RepID=UPI0030CFA5AB
MVTVTVSLMAISDLHIAHPENREHLAALRPSHKDDWLIVAGDVAERISDFEWAIGTLTARSAKVVWAPGNHELWTPRDDPNQLRGERRYQHLVEICRCHGVLTPEDPYPVWHGPGGPVQIVPLFVLYDYSFRPAGAATKAEGLAIAHRAGVVCTDEYLLHPDPFPTRDAWCRARVTLTEERLAARGTDHPTVLVNHFPLEREPTRILRYPEFAQWCGTERTADWHLRYDAAVVVYGHLHIPRSTVRDGVRFEEVSVGYPREWRRRGGPAGPRPVFPGGLR